ncbi:MAG: polyprenyl synthetase family protein [Thermodesulfobacteriota bacterium]
MGKAQLKEKLAEYKEIIESNLQNLFPEDSIPRELKEAMQYSLSAGGKRLRPILCLAWGQLFGGERERILDFATSLELIHTYSLVHDDLPAMDNDDYRRGKPANHIRFGESTAILAGDALLTEAFRLMLLSDLPPDRVRRAAAEVATSTGPRGMVGGQILDMGLFKEPDIGLETLKQMHGMKTAELIKVSCLSGAILAGAEGEDLNKVGIYGTCIGLAFQVADDILDVVGDKETLGKPVGSDEEEGKITYPSLIGLEESKKTAEGLICKAMDTIGHYQGEQAEFLRDLSNYIIQRLE